MDPFLISLLSYATSGSAPANIALPLILIATVYAIWTRTISTKGLTDRLATLEKELAECRAALEAQREAIFRVAVGLAEAGSPELARIIHENFLGENSPPSNQTDHTTHTTPLIHEGGEQE
jgi:hypothetical protein